MITEAGKKWIAEHFGVGNCWVYSGLSWTTYYTGGGSDPETGGTAKITSRLTNPAVNERVVLSSPRTGTYRTADLTAGNGGNVVSLDDVKFTIMPNDGYPAGETQYCYTAGAPPVTPPTGDTGIFQLCSLPVGATIRIDGAVVPWKAPLCPSWRDFVVSANVDHTIVYSLAGYKDDTQSESVTPGAYLQLPARMDTVTGGRAGYVRIEAHDAITGDALKARLSIDGFPLAKRFLTPHERNLPIAATKTEKDYDIAVTYPGYNKAEREVTVKTIHTVANKLLVDFRMIETKIWKEVEVVKEAKKVAWVTSITMDSPLIWDVSHTLKIKFLFYSDAKYQGFFDFYKIPPGWDYKLGSLKAYAAKVHTITSPQTDKLSSWEQDNTYTITWDWTCLRSIPEDVYVVVARLMYEV